MQMFSCWPSSISRISYNFILFYILSIFYTISALMPVFTSYIFAVHFAMVDKNSCSITCHPTSCYKYFTICYCSYGSPLFNLDINTCMKSFFLGNRMFSQSISAWYGFTFNRPNPFLIFIFWYFRIGLFRFLSFIATWLVDKDLF